MASTLRRAVGSFTRGRPMKLVKSFLTLSLAAASGPAGSGVALARLPVAEEYKKILLVEPAVADAITGERWNRYIFRTGRSSTQDAVAGAAALPNNAVIGTLAQD